MVTMQFRDRIIECSGCGRKFLFTVEEQRELVRKGLPPRRRYCQTCRSKGRANWCEGRVKWFDDSKGYGFIEWDGEEDVFVHYSSISGRGFRTLERGEKVRFRVKESEKGPQALNLIRISEMSTAFSFYSATRRVRN
ncbi:MAG: cold shock domain-containing protein [Chloroflexota bacterium]|nr:cold shock domain-containing protein [Chloroflexota bacterium]